jgi:hypothetical protein
MNHKYGTVQRYEFSRQKHQDDSINMHCGMNMMCIKSVSIVCTLMIGLICSSNKDSASSLPILAIYIKNQH